MTIGYENEIDDATLTATSETPGYPVENLQDSRMTRKWKTGTTGTVEVSGQITATFAVINSHNAVSGDTLTLKGYSDSGRTTLVQTTSFDLIGYGTAEIFDSANLYWSFEFAIEAGIEIGGLYLGAKMVMPAYEIGYKSKSISGDTSFISATKQHYGLNAFKYRQATFLIPHVTWIEKAEIMAFWESVGTSKDFYLLQFTDEQEESRVYYCRMMNTELEWKEHEKNVQVYKDLSIKIEETF